MAKVYVNDVGTVIRLLTDADLTTATLLQIKIKKPDEEIMTKTAVVEGSPADGIITYTTVAGDIDVSGNYTVQGYVEFADAKFHTESRTFMAHNLWE